MNIGNIYVTKGDGHLKVEYYPCVVCTYRYGTPRLTLLTFVEEYVTKTQKVN